MERTNAVMGIRDWMGRMQARAATEGEMRSTVMATGRDIQRTGREEREWWRQAEWQVASRGRAEAVGMVPRMGMGMATEEREWWQIGAGMQTWPEGDGENIEVEAGRKFG